MSRVMLATQPTRVISAAQPNRGIQAGPDGEGPTPFPPAPAPCWMDPLSQTHRLVVHRHQDVPKLRVPGVG